MNEHGVVAIGGSAGGIEALRALLPTLRPEWNLTFAIVLHRQSVEYDARLESLLDGWTPVPVRKARHGEPIVPGRAVVCPANVHLLVEDGAFSLSSGPRENHSRPSVDVTFRSVARACGPRGGAIVLSGLLDDGAAGMRAIREAGGLTIAQDPDEALYNGMPLSAIAAGAVHTLPLDEMSATLKTFAQAMKTPHAARQNDAQTSAQLTRLTCPDCNGVLAEQPHLDFPVYRCRVGHTFSPETLDAEKSTEIEKALWTAIQVLEEQIDITERLATIARRNGNQTTARRMESRAQRYRERAASVRIALPSISDAIESSETRSEVF